MANPNDQTDYIQSAIDNIYTILSNYKSYIGYKILEKTDDALIPLYPAITIDFDSMTEDWKEMPRRKTLSMVFSITYYYTSMSDKGVRQGLRTGLSKITNVFRENFDLNGFCSQLGAEVLSVTPYVLAKGEDVIAGGVIVLQCNKVVSVTFA